MSGGQPITEGQTADEPAGHAGPDDGPGAAADLAPLARALTAARDGDFSVRLAGEGTGGALGDVAEVFDELMERNQRLTEELVRMAREIGREGRMTERARLDGVGGDRATGAWATGVDSLNGLIDDLVRPTTEIARDGGHRSAGWCSRAG